MQVENRLSGPPAHVVHRPVSILDPALPRNRRRYHVAMPDYFRVRRRRLFQAGNVSLGNDQDVRRRLRINVLDRDGVRVFVNFLGGNLVPDNAAEKAFGVHGVPVYRNGCRRSLGRAHALRASLQP